MRRDGAGSEPQRQPSDGALWRRSVMTDAVPNETERLLDLAGFADGLLDADERERVAEWLARDADGAADVAAARSIAAESDSLPPAPHEMIARAAALVGGGRYGNIRPFPTAAGRARLQRAAGWGSLAAALAVASWLGFILGVDTSLPFSQFQQVRDDGFLSELLDPSAAFARDLPGGAQT